MKDIIGSIFTTLIIVFVFWAVGGIYGVSIGSNDDITRSFVWSCHLIGIGA